jgi:hypothetical protein
MEVSQIWNMFYRLREEKKLGRKKFIEKFIEELRNERIDDGRNFDQFLRTPSNDQLKKLMGKINSES